MNKYIIFNKQRVLDIFLMFITNSRLVYVVNRTTSLSVRKYCELWSNAFLSAVSSSEYSVDIFVVIIIIIIIVTPFGKLSKSTRRGRWHERRANRFPTNQE